MPKQKTTGVPFKLVDISTDEFATIEKHYEIGNYDFAINFGVDFNLSKDQNIIGCFTKYEFEQNDELVLILKTGCHFEISKEYWTSQTEDNILTLDSGFLTHLLLLTVGTSRGILHAKKPKWLESLLLPTLNVTSIISDDMAFDLDASDDVAG